MSQETRNPSTYDLTSVMKDHPSYRAEDSEYVRLEKFKKYLVQRIVNREADVENAMNDFICMRDLGDSLLNLHGIMKEKLEIIKEFASEFRPHGDFDKGLHYFKEKHSLDRIDYRPEDDGLTHINIYSKGKTELGRIASNFAQTPFKHPEYGYFASIEAFWYWLSSGKCHDILRNLSGFQAKKMGLRYVAEGRTNVENFQREIKRALFLKMEQNPRFLELLKDSNLPLTHYYLWGEPGNYRVTKPENQQWQVNYLSDLRDFLNGKAHRLLIAGSRTIQDDEITETSYLESGFKAVEIISGMARKGPDDTAVRISAKYQIPLKPMPADWDKHGKSAGYLRNRDMGDVATAAVIVWDGVSRGTKSMVEICIEKEVPYHLVVVKLKEG